MYDSDTWDSGSVHGQPIQRKHGYRARGLTSPSRSRQNVADFSDFDDELDLEAPMRPMSADRMRSSPGRRPLRANHELGIPLQDSDSGFSSTMRTKPECHTSPQRHQQHRNRSPHIDSYQHQYTSPMLSDTESIVSSPAHIPSSSRLFRSRSMTRLDDSLLSDSISMPNSPGKYSERHRYRNIPDRLGGVHPGIGPSSAAAHRHMKDMLEDSENRRAVLMHKLKEAQITLQAQNERLELIENAAKDNSVLVEELKCKEKDYRHRISSLTREQDDKDALRRENLHLREEMQNRITTLDLQLKTLHNQHSVTESDNKKRNGLLEQTTMTLTLLEEENSKLQKERDTSQSELYTNRDSIHIVKTKNALLDEENRTLKQDLYRLDEEDKAVQTRLCELSSQVEELRMLSQTLRGENEKLTSAWECSLEEKQKLKKDLDCVQEKCSEMKTHFNTAVAERDRVLHEKMDIHQSLQQLILDKEHLMKTKLSLEEQLCKLNADTEDIHLANEQHEIAKRNLEEELQAVKKVSKDLSAELSTVKNAYERTQEQTNLLENGKRLSAEQHRLVEQENCRLETEVTKMKQLVEAREDECRKEREQLEESAHRLRDELRSLRMNKTELEDSCHDLEMRLKRTSGELQNSTSMQHTEIDTWRNTCERLTKSVSSKEAELQELSDKCAILDEMVSKLKVDGEQYKDQAEGLMYEQQEMDRLKIENNELLKQKEEDEQMIRLLEMQKAVFAKTSENEFGNLQEIEQLSNRLTEMERENENLRDRIDDLQKENDNVLLQQEGRNLNDSDMQMSDVVDAPDLSRFVGVKNERERLRQMNAVLMRRVEFLEQERTDSRLRDDTDMASSLSFKQELDRLRKENSLLQFERDHLRKQHKVLEEKHHRFIISFGHGREQQPLPQTTELSTEMQKMKKQNEILQKQLNLVKGQLKIYKGGKIKLKQLGVENEILKEEPSPQQNGILVNGNAITTHKLTGDMMNLKQELEQSHYKQKEQEDLITSLKRELSKHIQERTVIAKESLVQSLDDVSDELVQVKSELERLMGVIDHKDQEIDELDTQLQESLGEGDQGFTKSPKQQKSSMSGMRVSKFVKNTEQPAFSATPRPAFKSKLQSLLDKYSSTTQPNNDFDNLTNVISYESNHNDTHLGHHIGVPDDSNTAELVVDQTPCNDQQMNSVDYPGETTSQAKYDRGIVESSAETETPQHQQDSSDSQDDDANAVRLSYMDLVKF